MLCSKSYVYKNKQSKINTVNIVIISQLNGVNGEVTGSDDVSMIAMNVDELKRRCTTYLRAGQLAVMASFRWFERNGDFTSAHALAWFDAYYAWDEYFREVVDDVSRYTEHSVADANVAMEYIHYHLYDLGVAEMELRRSALNGSHGEATNDDDLADPRPAANGNPLAQARQRAADRRRVAREARNHQHQRPVNVERAAMRVGERVANRPPPGVLLPLPVPPAQLLPPPPIVHVKTLYVVMAPGDDFGYTGSRFVKRAAGFLVDGDGNTYAEGLSNVQVPNVLNSGPGWYEQTTDPAKGAAVFPRFCTDTMVIPRFMSIGCEKEYKYFIPLMTDLRRTFPGVIEKRVATAARAKASKDFDRCMPQALLDSTINAFLAGKAHDSLGLLTDEAARIVNMRYSSGGVIFDEEIAAYTTAGIEQVSDSSWTVPGITCADIPYTMKTTFNIRTRGQVVYAPVLVPHRVVPNFDNNLQWDMVPNGNELKDRYDRGELETIAYEDGILFIPKQMSNASINPTFTHNLGGDRAPKYKLTSYFRVEGERKFVIYDVNAKNASIALKRIVGSRDFESFYYKQQFGVLGGVLGLQKDTTDYLDILAVLRTGWDRQGRGFTVGHFGKPEDGFGLPRYHEVRTAFSEADKTVASVLFPDVVTPFHNRDSYADSIAWVSECMNDFANNCTYDGLFEKIVTKNLDKINNGMHHWSYYSGYEQLLSFMSPIFSREFAASIPHAKKSLREAYVKGVLLHDNEDIMVRRLNACVKKELAKGGGKAPRLFVSYAAGCMYANELPEWTKVLMDSSPDPNDPAAFESFASKSMPHVNSFAIDGCTCNVYIMAKMRSGAMDKAFNDMIHAMDVKNHLHVLIYSDDSVYVGNINGVRFAYNVDISSCDSSQGPLVFALTGKILHQLQPDRAFGLLKQCMLPIVLTNTDDPDSTITVETHGPFEGSGTVLTTILNHFASFGIAVSSFKVMARNLQLLSGGDLMQLDANLSQCIMAGAALVGHKVTVETCRVGGEVVVEKIQFLKRSPMLTTDGDWVAATNYGCLLRSFGTCEGDMVPAQLGLTPEQFVRLHEREKMEMFCRGVVKGMVHEPSSPILDALRALFVGETRTLAGEFGVPSAGTNNVELRDSDRSRATLSIDSICRRYGITEYDIQELAACLGTLGLGRVVCSPTMTSIYSVDYSL